MDYAIEHEGKHYGPDGEIQIEDTEAYNRDIEAHELAWLKTAPDKVFLYVHMPERSHYDIDNHITPLSGSYITTWLGTRVSDNVSVVGISSYFPCFGGRSKRRPVDCRIFGTRYVGWYMESSGNYCRLRKAKRQ